MFALLLPTKVQRMSDKLPPTSVRFSFTCPTALAARVKAMSERSGVPLHVLLVHMCEQLACDGVSVRVAPIADVRATRAVSAQPLPHWARLKPAEDGQVPLADDDVDTQKCRDCAAVLPITDFTPDGQDHMDCPTPGISTLARRKAALAADR